MLNFAFGMRVDVGCCGVLVVRVARAWGVVCSSVAGVPSGMREGVCGGTGSSS